MKNIKFISLLLAAFVSLMFSFSASAGAGGPTVIYSYDANNCLVQAVYSNNRTVNYSYDNNGNLTAITYSGDAVGGPVINTQPIYSRVFSGETLILKVIASGSGLTYQWYKDGVALGDGGDISGATSASLSVANLETLDAGSYYCLITDDQAKTKETVHVNVFVPDSAISDLWTSTTYLAPGSRFKIYDFEIPYMSGSFTAKPKVLMGELVAPVKGKTKTYALSLVTTPSADLPLENLECLWKSPVLLYDTKSLKTYYKSGFNCADFLTLAPQYDEDTFIKIQVTGGTVQYLSRFFSLVPPDITDVKDAGNVSITSASAGDIITVEGDYFGQKAPSVWMEYKVAGNAEVKKLVLKVQTPLEYPDSKTVAGMSCMDIDSGASKIKVLIPLTLPTGIIKENNNIVIENKQGLATYPFDLN